MNNSEAKQDLVVNKTIEIQANTQKVWDMLTNPENTKQYFFNCEVHSDWRVGSDIIWKGNYQGKDTEVKGKILAIEPGKLLKYTAWGKESGLEDIPENHTIVTASITEINGVSSLTVTDENFGTDEGAEKRYQASVKGWDMVLQGLKNLAEKQ